MNRSRMNGSITILLTSIAFVSCVNYESRSDVGSGTKDSLIVFYSLAETSRLEIASSLEKINSFGPKLIALEVIFEDLRDHREDSILASTLRKLDNVVFSADIVGSNSTIGRTHEFFNARGSQEGLLSYVVNEDGTINSYVPLFQNSERQMPAFPDMIVYNFRPETITRFIKMHVNESVKVDFAKSMENFNTIDRGTLAADLVQDKIVIVGPLNVHEDDYFSVIVKDRKTKTFSQVITANIILNILSEHKNNPQTEAD